MNRLDFVFFTLYISHKPYVSLNSMSLVKDFPLCTSSFESKNKLKSPVITSCFAGFISNSSSNSNKMRNKSIYSFSVLALYKFIKMYSESLMETSRIKMRTSLSVSFFFNDKSSCSKVSSKE